MTRARTGDVAAHKKVGSEIVVVYQECKFHELSRCFSNIKTYELQICDRTTVKRFDEVYF